MAVEFRQLDTESHAENHLDDMSVRFGVLEDGPDDTDAQPTMMLAIGGEDIIPLDRDEAVSLILALQEKIRTWDYFWRIAPDHCKECVDQMIAGRDQARKDFNAN